MAYKDQCWIGKTLYYNSKGALTAQLKSWWYPPPTPAPNTNSSLSRGLFPATSFSVDAQADVGCGPQVSTMH